MSMKILYSALRSTLIQQVSMWLERWTLRKGKKSDTDGKAENEMEMRSGKWEMGNRNRIGKGLAAGNACHCFCYSCSRFKLCSRSPRYSRPHSLHIDGQEVRPLCHQATQPNQSCPGTTPTPHPLYSRMLPFISFEGCTKQFVKQQAKNFLHSGEVKVQHISTFMSAS